MSASSSSSSSASSSSASSSTTPEWLQHRQEHVRQLRELKAKVEKLQPVFRVWASALKAWLDMYDENAANGSAVDADKFSARISQLAVDVDAALQKCVFVDPLTLQEHVIGARVGVVGREKAGKSSFLSAWATGGESLDFLPTAKEPCTGTTVKIHPLAATQGTKFAAVVTFFSEKEMMDIMRDAATKLIRQQKLPIVKSIFEATDSLNVDMQQLHTILAALPAASEPKELVLLRNYDQLWGRLRKVVGAKPHQLEFRDARTCGQDLRKYVDIKCADSLTSAVKLVDVYAPLAGITTNIELSDVPGNGSANAELNRILEIAIKELDVILFIKETHNPVLDEAEANALHAIRKCHRSFDNTLVIFSRQDEHWAKGELPATSAITAFNEGPCDFQVKSAHFHFVSAYLRDRTKGRDLIDKYGESLRSVCAPLQKQIGQLDPDHSHTPLSVDNLDGYARMLQHLSTLLDRMPNRDRTARQSLQDQCRALTNDIRNFIKQVGNQLNANNITNPNNTEVLAARLARKLLAAIKGQLQSFVASSAHRRAKAVLYRFDPHANGQDLAHANLPSCDSLLRAMAAMDDPNGVPDSYPDEPTTQQAEDRKCVDFVVGELRAGVAVQAQQAVSSNQGLPVKLPLDQLQDMLDAQRSRQCISFSSYETWLRSIVFDEFLQAGLNKLLNQEKVNAWGSVDSCLLATLAATYNGGRLLHLFTEENKASSEAEQLTSFLVKLRTQIQNKAAVGSVHQGADSLFRRLIGIQPGAVEAVSRTTGAASSGEAAIAAASSSASASHVASAHLELRAVAHQRLTFAETVQNPLEDRACNPDRVGSCLHTVNYDWNVHKENQLKLNASIQSLEKTCFDEATGILAELQKWDKEHAHDKRLGKALFDIPSDVNLLKLNLPQLLKCCENNMRAIDEERKNMSSPFVFLNKGDRLKQFAAKAEQLDNLKRNVTELQTTRIKLSNLENAPGKNRLRHLQSLFCVPLTLTADDFEEWFSNNPNCDPLDKRCSALLLAKQHRLFVEPSDFAQPHEHDEEALKTKFPAFEEGKNHELSVLNHVLLSRTSCALEHLIELLEFKMLRENSFSSTRTTVRGHFQDALFDSDQNEEALRVIILRAAKQIWPQHFQSGHLLTQMKSQQEALQAMLSSPEFQ